MTHATTSTPRFQMVKSAVGLVFVDRSFKADRFDAFNLGRAILEDSNGELKAVRVTRDIDGKVAVFHGSPVIEAWGTQWSKQYQSPQGFDFDVLRVVRTPNGGAVFVNGHPGT